MRSLGADEKILMNEEADHRSQLNSGSNRAETCIAPIQSMKMRMVLPVDIVHCSSMVPRQGANTLPWQVSFWTKQSRRKEVEDKLVTFILYALTKMCIQFNLTAFLKINSTIRLMLSVANNKPSLASFGNSFQILTVRSSLQEASLCPVASKDKLQTVDVCPCKVARHSQSSSSSL